VGTAAEAANYVLMVFLHLSGMNLFDEAGSTSFADHFQALFSASAKLPEKHQAKK
jgi:Ni,Fe-hydrogenase I cytochrome b subunit